LKRNFYILGDLNGGFRPNAGTPTFPNDLRQSATSLQQPIPGQPSLQQQIQQQQEQQEPQQQQQLMQMQQQKQQQRMSGSMLQQQPTSGHTGETGTSKVTIPEIAESNWSVQPITCLETRTKEFPLYLQLGPAAGHRGNQGKQNKGLRQPRYCNGPAAPPKPNCSIQILF
jgi:hypothetical protein